MTSAESAAVATATVAASGFRVDASAFLRRNAHASITSSTTSSQVLSDVAEVFTVYIQTPLLCYVERFADSRPYLTTSELGEYQRGAPKHVSLITDPRLIEWEVKQGYIILSRSGRVGETYWIDKKLAGALVGDSFRVVPKDLETGYFVYALLSSRYAKNYMTGVSYGSVVDHASVDHARSLPLPQIESGQRRRIVGLIQEGLAARESAYDLLDEAERFLLGINGLPDLTAPAQEPFEPLGQIESFDVLANTVTTNSQNGADYRLDAHFYNPTAQLAVANIEKCRFEVNRVGDVARVLFTGGRFKRNYVESAHGVPFLSGKNIVQIRPTDLKHLANVQMADLQELLLKRGWTLITRSGTIGRTCFVWKNYEEYAASEHIIRAIPDNASIDPGYLYAFLSSPYGYEQLFSYRHGSVIDEITDKQIEHVLVPRPSRKDQETIGDLVRKAYEKRAEAIRLEDEAQAILMNELTKGEGAKGV